MVAVCPTVAPTFDKNPNIPLALFDTSDRVPFNTPTPTLDGFLVMFFSSRVGCMTKSLKPVLKDVSTMVGFPTISTWINIIAVVR